MRNFSLLPDGEPVHLYDGRLKGNQEAAAAVFAMPVLESGDVQQCADSVMRMYAEYFWHSGQPGKDRVPFCERLLVRLPHLPGRRESEGERKFGELEPERLLRRFL